MKSCGEVSRVDEHLLYSIVESHHIHVAHRDENAIFEDEADGFYIEVVLEEVAVRLFATP